MDWRGGTAGRQETQASACVDLSSSNHSDTESALASELSCVWCPEVACFVLIKLHSPHSLASSPSSCWSYPHPRGSRLSKQHMPGQPIVHWPLHHSRLTPNTCNCSVAFCVSVPDNPPVNVTAVLNGTEVLMTWEEPPGKLNGELQGYMVEYSTPGTQQVSQSNISTHKLVQQGRYVNICPICLTLILRLFLCWQLLVDTGLDTELLINLTVPLSNVSFRVCAYTGAGQGPWTPTQTLTLIAPG